MVYNEGNNNGYTRIIKGIISNTVSLIIVSVFFSLYIIASSDIPCIIIVVYSLNDADSILKLSHVYTGFTIKNNI